MSQDSEITWGSGNVFADLGLPDAEEELLKAQLASHIRAIIKQRGLTQLQASKILGLAQPNLSRLLSGKMTGYSVERLLRYITTLGSDVDVVLRLKSEPQQRGRVNILTA